MSVKIYTTHWCQPCRSAKTLLNELGITYKELDIEKLEISRNNLYNLTGGRTVPQIVINENPIGGFDELSALHQSGDLDRILDVAD